MDSLNFTIDGDLGLPGFVRVPPPFGTPRHAVRAIHATLARAEDDARLAAAATAHQVSRAQWHRRLTVLAIGVAITITTAVTLNVIGAQMRDGGRQQRRNTAYYAAEAGVISAQQKYIQGFYVPQYGTPDHWTGPVTDTLTIDGRTITVTLRKGAQDPFNVQITASVSI